MPLRPQIDDHGVIARYKDTDTGEVVSAKDYERRMMLQQTGTSYPPPGGGQLQAMPPAYTGYPGAATAGQQMGGNGVFVPPPPAMPGYPQAGAGMSGYPQMGNGIPSPYPAPVGAAPNPYAGAMGGAPMGGAPMGAPAAPYPSPMGAPAAGPNGGPLTASMPSAPSSLIQPGATMLDGSAAPAAAPAAGGAPAMGGDAPPTAGMQSQQGKNLRIVGLPHHQNTSSPGYKTHGFLDATSIAILLPTLVLLALIIAAAHKKRLFPWQTIRTFNPPSGLMTPRDYERSYVCPPNLRRHGRLGKRNPQATWTEQDGIVIPFGFLARTHLPITIPLGRLPNKNMFLVAPSGSGKTTLMRAIIKALMAKPCVIIALEAKANDPQLDEKRESFKHTVLPEAQTAGFDCLYFNPLDPDSIHWNPLDLDAITFASSIVQDINSLDAEEQHWAERDHGYITGLTQLLKWGAVMVSGEDENGQAVDVQPLPCNPRGLMRLVNNRRNIVESLRRLKNNPDVNPAELSELTQTLSSIIRTDSDWDKNIQGVRGRLRMFKNPGVLRCTEDSNIDIRAAMHKATVLIFGAPASMGPDAESLASTFVYQLQNALHSRYGTASLLPLFAFFDEYQTLNMDIAGRLSAIVRGANGGLTIILQNISQIAQIDGGGGGTGVSPELKTIFSNSAIRVCLHNADESTAKFFSDEIGKHAIIVPGISDHYDANGFGIFPTSWNRIHSQQVVPRVDADGIKRMEKHHALVYLSPAGDPEFGEVKPFMCDLRGIEEIARLHLLHNVAGRGAPDGGGPDLGPDGGQGAGQGGGQGGHGGAIPPGAMPSGAPGQIPSAAKIGSPVLAKMMTPQGLEKAAEFLGRSAPTGAPPAAPGIPGAHPGHVGPGQAVAAASATAIAAAAAAALGPAAGATLGAGGGAPRPPFPNGTPSQPAGLATTGNMPVQQPQRPGVPSGPAPGVPSVPAQGVPSVPVNGVPSTPVAANGVPSTAASDRSCAKCGKWPGKGRFCIECGTFVGQPAAAAAPAPGGVISAPAPGGVIHAPAQQPVPVPAAHRAPATAHGAAAAPAPAGVAQRQPVTSLHVDLNKYGLGNPGEQQPGQTPVPRPQNRGGIEF